MNRQEAIESLQEMAKDSYESDYTSVVYIDDIVEIINKIDEPQKPVVPKFVAEWIEECKHDRFYALHGAYAKMNSRLIRWRLGGGNSELFAKAWIYGYVIEGEEEEEEKLYTVEIPNPDSDSLTVLEKFYDGTVEISQMDVFPVDWRNLTEYHLTEKEIRKDFEWAWQWAKEVE
jgi:hypothetical protein